MKRKTRMFKYDDLGKILSRKDPRKTMDKKAIKIKLNIIETCDLVMIFVIINFFFTLEQVNPIFSTDS